MSRDYSAIPIPTYEEAISRPSSSQRLGPTESSHDAQRQSLLNSSSSYRLPTVESVRNSLESDLSVPEMGDGRVLEELDYLEPGQSEADDRDQARRYHRARLRSKFAQSLSSLGATLGSLRIPSLRRLYTAVPSANTEEEATPRRSWRERVQQRLFIPKEYRMSVPTFIRLCALMVIFSLIWFLFTAGFFPRRRNMWAPMFEPESVKVFVMEHIDAYEPHEYMEHLSSFTHEGGSEGSYYLARWVFDTWKDVCKFDQETMSSYSILATYPVEGDRSVSVIEPADLAYTAVLEEPRDAGGRQQTLAWHAHSASGTVEGPLVYANAGSREDFEKLQAAGVVTNGSIALVYSNADSAPHNTALKIRFAQEAGCAGVLVYNGDSLTTTQEITTFSRPGNQTVHRANVVLSNWLMGDPLTPGKASDKGQPKDREAAALALPSIPSLPLSHQDATELMHRLGDKGYRFDGWLPKEARTGDGHVKLRLQNQNDLVENQQVWQVQTVIHGAEAPEQKIIIGAPRDAWCFDASHSASATAIMTHIINVFGDLRELGWAPLRTIEFASWDGNIFNNAGSTEYVEGHLNDVREQTIAYLNIAGGISGHDLKISGSPLLKRSIQHALDRVTVPDGDKTLKDAFEALISNWRRSAAITDSSAFTYIAGVPTLDMSFEGIESEWVRGSCADTLAWTQQAELKDDLWPYHKAFAQVWALLILDLASEPLIPMNVGDYAETFAGEVDAFERDANQYVNAHAKDISIDFTPIREAADFLHTAAVTFHDYENEWTASVLAQGGIEDLYQNRLRLSWNARLVQFEKGLIDFRNHKSDGSAGGLKDRPQFRHILTAPEKWSDGLLPLPSVWDFLEDLDWEEANKEISRIAAMIKEAATPLSAG